MALRFSRTRLVQLGIMAGGSITLPAEVLRACGLEIMGSGSGAAPPFDLIVSQLADLLAMLGNGDIVIDIDRVPLSDIDREWDRDHRGRRLVFDPRH